MSSDGDGNCSFGKCFRSCTWLAYAEGNDGVLLTWTSPGGLPLPGLLIAKDLLIESRFPLHNTFHDADNHQSCRNRLQAAKTLTRSSTLAVAMMHLIFPPPPESSFLPVIDVPLACVLAPLT